MESYRQLVGTGIFVEYEALILDSGCGTGNSTLRLAELYPQHLVIGIDRSQARLSKSGVDSSFYRRGNCVLIRAELATFWRLLLADGIFPERHFLLYPNPYPKSAHLSRRWHGHPVFPQLLSLGGEIEMRCNWEIYAQEFALAVSLACDAQIEVTVFAADDGISPFERKYHERGQKLYAVKVPAQLTAGFRQDIQ
jgi:tRNA G46 methylase TrmB